MVARVSFCYSRAGVTRFYGTQSGKRKQKRELVGCKKSKQNKMVKAFTGGPGNSGSVGKGCEEVRRIISIYSKASGLSTPYHMLPA